ncbi:CUB and sushi domain-containing protein 3 [Orchesella cincta]|uniref:CUB and sushi domain-containing protein 3 n=1 Tax=Orchesella cincta TaxID=48709 RepID=A0A1D2M464_ORCCI|nr:CUB and sushi domain-containing protein 3 [Orchesella cincta]
MISRANNAQAFEESTIIITFRSDGSTTGNGFILQFSPRGLKSHSEYNYKLNHVSDLYGVFEFPDANPFITRNDIYIMVSSPLDTTSKGVQIQSSIVRQNVNSCINNSVTFYEVSGRSWAIRQRFPDAVTCTNVDSVKKSYSPRYLAIYKPESANQSTHFRIEYSVAVTSVDSCGGNLRGKFGEISYKVNGTYRENERCSWTLEVPQAQRISFYLEQSRFEECCDYVTVSSANTPAVRFSKMQFKIFCTLVVVVVCFTAWEIYKSSIAQHVIKKRSIKDAFPKDELGETLAISYVRNKIFSLEDSMKSAKGKLAELSNQNEQLAESMREQKTMLQTMAEAFTGIEEQLSAHGSILSDYEKMCKSQIQIPLNS